MEEEVSNYLQDRHKFVVDILLTVVLLEEEMESLTQRIEEFEARQREARARAAGQGSDGGAQDQDVDEEALQLAEQHRAELQRRREELNLKKEEQLRMLQDRIDCTCGVAAYVADLLAEAVQKVSGAAEKCVDTGAVQATVEGLRAEYSEEAAAVAAQIEAEMRHTALAADEALVSNQLVLQHERDLKKLKASLEDAQEQQRAALRERLSKKRSERSKDLLVDGAAATPEEAEALAAAEVAQEEEAGRAEITRAAEEKLKHFADSSLAEIKTAAESAAGRLEDSLNAQKSEQQRALMRRLERRRLECERQVQSQVAAAGDSISAAQKEAILVSAIAKVESAAEEEATLLEAQNLAAVRAMRAQMVQLVRSEHEKECERLETELLAQKERRVRDLKGRLEKKKADRAKEILAEAGGKSVTSAVAVALANEEVSAEEKQALAAIAGEADASMEQARRAVLGGLVELHQKESARLEEDMKYQENMQRTNLANRLERQRKAREREMLASAAATASAATESAPAVTAEEIKRRVEEEMAALAQQEEQALQQSLLGLKEQQQREAAQLADELTYKKTTADKRLQDRLAQRAAKAAQDGSAAASRTVSRAATARVSSPLTIAGLDADGSRTPLAPVVEAAVPEFEEGSMTADAFLSALKESQRQLLARLDMFIQFEKTAVTAQKQAAVRAAGTKHKSEAALSDLAKTALLFDHLTEFMALGLKKTMLYETKAMKDAIARSKAESASGAAHRLAAAEVKALRDPKHVAAAQQEASEKVLERFQRDVAGLVDSQSTERRGSVAELLSSGSSLTAVQSAVREMADYHAETIVSEVEKAVLVLAGVWISPEFLGESAAPGAAGSAPQPSIQEDRGVGSDEDEDVDAELFLSKKRASTIDLHKLKQRSTFGPRIIQWFADLLALVQLYSSTPAVMLLTFDKHCAEVTLLRTALPCGGYVVILFYCSAEGPAPGHKRSPTGAVRGVPLSAAKAAAGRGRARVPAAHGRVRASPCAHCGRGPPFAVPPVVVRALAVIPSFAQESAVEEVRRAVQASSQTVAVDPAGLFAQAKSQYYDAATGKDALCVELLAAYSAAVAAYVDRPVLTAAELSKAREAAQKATTPAASTQAGRVSDMEARKVKLTQAVSSGVDRLKGEVREKYRKMGYAATYAVYRHYTMLTVSMCNGVPQRQRADVGARAGGGGPRAEGGGGDGRRGPPQLRGGARNSYHCVRARRRAIANTYARSD
jgi:hypothetical protein